MPGSYRIDVARGIVFTRGWGVLTDVQIAAHAKALGSDPRHDPAFKQIVDFSGLTEIRVTSEGVRDVARINPFRRDARRAIVVASDEAFGLSRMFGFLADANNDQFAIFRALEPAMEWVGLDPKTPWPEEPPDATFGAD
jgi:hypothetical protein